MTARLEEKTTRRICIIQSAYVPWRGFFDLIGRCDEYVILDSAQFVKGHWQNRNRVCGPKGPAWLTIPVVTAGQLGQAIEDVMVSDAGWAGKHWSKLETCYAGSPFFADLCGKIRPLYEAAGQCRRLTDINEIFLRGLADLLGIRTAIVRDHDYSPRGKRTERVADICLKAGATHYLTGPSARAYFDVPLFAETGVALEWMTYPEYPAYQQAGNGYDPALSILDLLFSVGPQCSAMWRGENPSRLQGADCTIRVSRSDSDGPAAPPAGRFKERT
jgi:hypothetical protein